MNCKVTVLFFAYNAEKYIGKGIEAALNQETNFDYKIIVCDDCSPDNTSQIVRQYQALYPNRIELRRPQVNKGLNWQVEHAILDVDTDYIAYTDGDDCWIDKYKLQKQVDYLETHDDTSMVITNKINVDEETGEEFQTNNYWSWDMPADRKERLCSLFLGRNKGNYPSITTSCIRTAVVKKCLTEKPWIIRYPLPGEGTTILTGICLYGGKIHYLNDVTVAYLVRKNSLSHHSDKIKALKYTFEYTVLRLKVMKDIGVCNKKMFEYAKVLFINDLNASYIGKTLKDLKSLAIKSDLPIGLKLLFLIQYSKFQLKNKFI